MDKTLNEPVFGFPLIYPYLWTLIFVRIEIFLIQIFQNICWNNYQF